MKGSEENNHPKTKLRIAVYGQSRVGKSALTVRYLTRRYIGEYKSDSDMFYHQTLSVNHGTNVEIEIVDISTTENSPLSSPSKWDGIILVYSIIDKSSFNFAMEFLDKLSSNQNLPPTILIGNKSDLEHLRVVEKVEGLSLAMDFGCISFYELSVADNSPQVYQSFNAIINNFTKPKRRFSMSKILYRLGKMGIAHKTANNGDNSSSGSDTSIEGTVASNDKITSCRSSLRSKLLDFHSHSPKKTINCS